MNATGLGITRTNVGALACVLLACKTTHTLTGFASEKKYIGTNQLPAYYSNMADSETVPILGKRGDFRTVVQPEVPDTVACCCVESTRLAKVPVVRTLFRKRRPEEKVL